MRKNNLFFALIVYFFIALFCTICDFIIFYICRHVLYANIVIANVCGFSIGFIANYFLGLMFVFYDKDISMQHKKLLYTLIISIIGLVINTTIVSVFSNVIACSVYINKLIPCNVAYNNLNEILAKLLAAVVTFNWNFFARKLFVYKN